MLFWSSFTKFAAIYLSFLMKTDPDGFNDEINTSTVDDLLSKYDFIVLGAGSAGSVVASRLSENDDWNILLIEAGGQENHFSRTPAVWQLGLSDSRFSWNYTTTPQKHTCHSTDGVCAYPRGRALGGSSSTNAMALVRGYPSDYDRWGQENPGWSFADVHPYFLKSQDNRISGLTERGTEGPLTVSYSNYRGAIDKILMKAGEEMGWANKECMNYESDCIEFTQLTIRDGRRCSASTAFLEQAHTRKNLHILSEALVTKLLLDGNVAKGVEFEKGGQKYSVNAGKEVILSMGTFGSPQMLMLSGIGPRDHLESLDIEVRADLPVGNNLQDHKYVGMSFEVDHGTITNSDLENSMDEYVKKQTGPLSSGGSLVMVYSTLGKPGPPLIHHMFAGISKSDKHLISVSNSVMKPKSTGTLRLRCADPKAAPLLDPNAFSHDEDFKLTHRGMKKVFDLMGTNAMKCLNPKVVPQDPCNKTEPIDEFITCLITSQIELYHAVGTVKMAPKNKDGVVDSRLKVYGIDKLRVIDASIAPSIVSVNTNAMSIMIGEKGADIIKEDFKNEETINW